jgi:PAS domain S-box-containing protein
MDRTVLLVASGGDDGPEELRGVAGTVRTVGVDGIGEVDAAVDCAVVGPGLDREDCLGALDRLAEVAPEAPVVVSSADADGHLAAEATRRGADEYHVQGDGSATLAERIDALIGADDRSTGSRALDAAAESVGTRPIGTDGGTASTPPVGTGWWSDDASVSARSALAAIARGSPDGIALMDGDSEVLFVNEGFERLTGYDREEILGSSFTRVVPDDMVEDHRAAIAEFERDDERLVWESVEVPIATADGGQRFVSASFGGFEESGDVYFACVLRDIEDRRAREAELERYEDVIEAVDDGVYALDDDGRFVLVNEAMTELTGYSREELRGEHTRIIKDPQTVQLAEQTLRDMVYGEEPETTFDLTLTPKERDPFPSEDHMVMLTDDDGEFAGTAGVIRDITERKERDRRLSELLETSRSLMRAHSREEVADIVVGATADTLGYDVNLVRLYDEDSETLQTVTSTTRSDEILGDRPVYEVGEGGPGKAFADGEVKHYPTEVDGPAGESTAPIAETIYVPLGEYGVLSIGSTEVDAFDESDVSMAEILASNAAVALSRAAREAELVRYQTVMENVRDMMYVLDESGRFTLVTEPLAEWLGYERDELRGADPQAVLKEGAYAGFESAIEDLWNGETAARTVQTAFVDADGEHLPAEVEVSLLPSEESFSGTVGAVRDRTELVETRQLLENERDRFTYLFDNLPDPVVETVFDDQTPIVEGVNESFTETFGYEGDRIRGESLNDYLLPPDRREEGHKLDRRAASGETVQQEVRRETVDGYRDFLFRGIPYETTDGRTRGFGIYTDITEQKERERRLEVLNRVLRHNLRNDLNVITGYAEIIEEQAADAALADRARTLRQKAEEVSSLSERARTIEQTIGRGSPRDGGVPVADIVADAVEGCREANPEMTVETDVDDESVVGDNRLTLAISELLENVAEHAGRRPRAVVETERHNGALAIRVLDDGPGIPETERAVIGESAEITQLQHASGLGLWIAKWLCESCGGRIEFGESRLGGSAVALVLNRRA